MGALTPSLLVGALTLKLLVSSFPYLRIGVIDLFSTALCLLHRAHMPPASSQSGSKLNGQSEEPSYPSKNIAFQAAAMITSIVENLARHGELRYCPAFM